MRSLGAGWEADVSEFEGAPRVVAQLDGNNGNADDFIEKHAAKPKKMEGSR